MPGEQRIGCHKGLQLIKCPAPRQFGLHGQSHPLFVGEPKSLSSGLLLEHTVLLDEIIDDHLLLAVKRPAGQRNYEEVKGLYDRGNCQNRLAAILTDNNIIRLVRIFAPYGRVAWAMLKLKRRPEGRRIMY